MEHYLPSYIDIIILIALMAVIVVQIIRNPQFLFEFNVRYPLAIGILSLIISMVLNSSSNNRWDANYLLSFLLLKKVSASGFYTLGAVLSYVVIFVGLLQLFHKIVFGKKD